MIDLVVQTVIQAVLVLVVPGVVVVGGIAWVERHG